MKAELSLISGTVIDEESVCRLHEVCKIYNITEEIVIEMVAEGVVTPAGSAPGEWRFDYIALQRITKTIRLQRDLQINLPGCALALDLLDELAELRRWRRRG